MFGIEQKRKSSRPANMVSISILSNNPQNPHPSGNLLADNQRVVPLRFDFSVVGDLSTITFDIDETQKLEIVN